MNYVTYEEAKEIAKSQSLKSNKAFKAWNKENPEKGIPQHPESEYRDHGWTNWYDFLGNKKLTKAPVKSNGIAKRMVTYEKASEIAVREGFKSAESYIKWKERPNNMPLMPNQTYAGRGWSGWRDFLKTQNINFEEFKAMCKKHNIKTVDELRDESISSQYNVPKNLTLAYKKDGFTSIKDITK